MKSYKTVDDFIANQTKWQDLLNFLRTIILKTELQETVKWGAPVYTINEKNVIGLGAFKSYAGLWLYQGALLKDEKKVLVNAQEGKTVAMRQWRFESMKAIDERMITLYLLEAIENQKQGKEIKPERNKPLIIPDKLLEVFKKDKLLMENFDRLSLSKKREYAEYIETAKQEATKMRRLEKIIPMILDGIGLNDKYR